MIFANRNSLIFEPAATVDLNASAVGYTTPAPYRLKLGGLSFINGNVATFHYKFKRVAGAGSVTVEINVKTALGTVLGTETKTVPVGDQVLGSFVLDIGSLNGGSLFYPEINVTTEDPGTTAEFWSNVDVETPVVSFGC